jgi:opacity protein-like surface antigen
MYCLRYTLAVLAFLLPACPALADSGSIKEDPYTRSGFYFGLGASFIAQLWEDDLADALDTDVDIDYGVAINAAMGWRINPWLAAELSYEGVKGYDVKISGFPDFRIDSHTMTANARIYYPLERWQPYVLLGVGMAHFDIHSNPYYSVKGGEINVGGRLGAGLDFYVTENIVLNASFTTVLTGFEFETPGRNAGGIHYLSTQFGAIYRF